MRADVDVSEDVFAPPNHEHLEALATAAETESPTAQIRDVVETAQNMVWRRRAVWAVPAQGSMPPISQIVFQ